MEVSYELTKDDYKSFLSELKKNKKNFWAFILSLKHYFLSLYFIILLIYVEFAYFSFLIQKILLIECSLISLLAIILFATFSPISLINLWDNSYFGKSHLKTISLNNENINIYSDKYYISFNKYQTQFFTETDNYYFIHSNYLYAPIFVIIPKKLFISEFEQNEITNILENYKNIKDNKNNKIHKQKRNSFYIVLFLTFVFIFLIILYPGASNKKGKMGVALYSVPMIVNVYDGSYAQKIGLNRGDIILKINNKYTFNGNLQNIAKKLQEDTVISVKKTGGEIIEYKINY